MRNAVFFVVLIFLLAGCNGKGPSIELKTKVDVASEQGLPVRVISQNQEPLPVKIRVQEEEPFEVRIKAEAEKSLPIKIVPDRIIIGAVIASLILAVVTFGAAIAAWRAACNTRKALEIIKNKLGE